MTGQSNYSSKKPSPIVFDVNTNSNHLTKEEEQLKNKFIKGAPLSPNSPKLSRKILPTVTIYLRIPEDLRDKIDELARKNNISRNTFCKEILEQIAEKRLKKINFHAS